jgi:dipeptide/tripeptide permease
MEPERLLGIAVVALSAVSFWALLSVSLEHSAMLHQFCSLNGEAPCTPYSHIPALSYVGFGTTIVGALIGVYLIFFFKRSVTPKADVKKAASVLSGDEKRAYDALLAADGSLMQSQLMGQLSLSKVRVSRILDRLEGRGLVERRRSGMTNVVLLKR